MIWLALHRHRTMLLVLLITVLGLDVWMLLTGHASVNALRGNDKCASYSCQPQVGAFSTAHQAAVIDLLLLALPCLMGVALGVALVAGEIERSTHHLAWMQGVSRTRWYVTSLTVITVASLVLLALELPIAHWWAGIAWVDLPDAITLGGTRIQPNVFGVSGVAPIAYTLFALALGAASGALLRRATWAIAATVVSYGLLAMVMVFVLRPTFAPTGFIADGTTDSAQYAPFPTPPPWNVTYEYRNIPGARTGPVTPSPDTIASACGRTALHPQDLVDCMRNHEVEGGFVIQPPSHYWRLQWTEAALYLGLAIALVAAGLVAIRRSQD